MPHNPGTYGLDPYKTRSEDGSGALYGNQRGLSPPRTPSPSPSELAELKKGPIDFKTVLNPRTYMKKKYIPWLILFAVIAVLTALMTLYHKQIVNWLKPISTKLKDLPGGWAIPIGILFVISFPPLFGHEIVAVLCGAVWGLWIGFGIVAAGTFLGEVGNFYAFRYICTARGHKLEKENLSYGCLARVVRDGGFMIALVARLSAIPGHFTTAVFSTCGMGIIVFSIAAILSLPKQLITVYLGVILTQSDHGATQEDKTSRIISDVVLVISFLVTIGAGWWIWKKMTDVKPTVLRERRKARALKDWELGLGPAARGPVGLNPYSSTDRLTANADDAFNPSMEDVQIGSNAPVSVKPQRWDAHGRAIPLLSDGPTRADSGDVAAWEMGAARPEYDGGSTAYAPRPAYAVTRIDSPSSIDNPFVPPVQSTTSYPPSPYHAAPSPPPSEQRAAYNDSYAVSNAYQTSQFAPPPGPPPGRAPQFDAQPQISLEAPRYQLYDGPAPSIISAAPTYQTNVPPDNMSGGRNIPPLPSYYPGGRV